MSGHADARLPHVTLKLATSLDGRIAMPSGESRWISGEQSRAKAHNMRAASDAVMIGAASARTDNPSLLARLDPAPARQPKRVVIAANFDLPTDGALFQHLEQSPLYVIGKNPQAAAAMLAAGAQIGIVANEGRHVDLRLALELLADQWGIARVLAEGGGQLAGSLLRQGLVDRIEWFRAPIVLGSEGKPAIGELALGALAEAPRWRRVALAELGPDLWESYERV